MTDIRSALVSILKSGLAAVSPAQALKRHVSLSGTVLKAGGAEYDLTKGNVYVAGAGKGAAPMGSALEELLGPHITRGVLVVKYGHALPLEHMEIIEGSHPVPDREGERGAEEILKIAGQCGDNDLLICLLTGGASALLPCPVAGVSLAELQHTTALLLASGAPINELNAIRKHLSRLSGGRLCQACKGRILAIIVSDVIGDDLSAIASGPTSPDPTTYRECLDILARYHLLEQAPQPVVRVLRKGAEGDLPETPKPGDPCFSRVTNLLVASNAQALTAAAEQAKDLGLQPLVDLSPLQGEAREAATRLAQGALEQQGMLGPGSPGICMLAGGETTVQIMGTGLGGRNQEMALAAALPLAGHAKIGALFAGTDGTDGPTDAAGGFAFGDSTEKMGGKGAVEAFLADNASNAALKKSGDLLITGPTLTNVMDLAIIIALPLGSGK